MIDPRTGPHLPPVWLRLPVPPGEVRLEIAEEEFWRWPRSVQRLFRAYCDRSLTRGGVIICQLPRERVREIVGEATALAVLAATAEDR